MKCLVLPANQNVAVEALEALDLILDAVWVVTVTLVVDAQAKVLGKRRDGIVWALAGAVCDLLSASCASASSRRDCIPFL